MSKVNLRDTIGGVLFTALSIYVLVGSFDYRMGTSRSMGPGYFPMLIGIVGTAIGILLTLPALVGGQMADRITPSVRWRPLLAVAASIVAFGLVIGRFGFLPAVFCTAVVAAAGDRNSRPLTALLLAAGTTLGAWLIFTLGLGLPYPPFRRLW